MVPLTPFSDALTMALPAPVALAKPEPLINATAALEEPQLTPTKVCELPSLKLPVAVNCCEPPAEMLGLAGEMLIEVKVAFVTVNCTVAVAEPSMAVIVEDPEESAETTPVWYSTVATLGPEDVQFTTLVRSCVVPSAKVPVMVSWAAVWLAI